MKVKAFETKKQIVFMNGKQMVFILIAMFIVVGVMKSFDKTSSLDKYISIFGKLYGDSSDKAEICDAMGLAMGMEVVTKQGKLNVKKMPELGQEIIKLAPTVKNSVKYMSKEDKESMLNECLEEVRYGALAKTDAFPLVNLGLEKLLK